MSVMRFIVLRLYTPSLKFVGLPVQKIWPISVMALSGLVTLTSDLSTSKWGHGFMGFLPANFQLATPILDLVSGTGQTNGDNGHRCIVPLPYGAGYNKTIK